MPTVNENSVLTKGEFQRYVEALDEETQEKIELIFASSDLTEIGYGEHYSFFPMRFDISGNTYSVPDVIRTKWTSSKMITSGEYISNEDEASGAYSAIVSQEDCDKKAGDTIEFLGNSYTVVGTYKGASYTPIVPFLTVPEDIPIAECSFSFTNTLTRSTYENLKNTAKETIPGKLIFPDLLLPDDDSLALYRNIILTSVLVAVVSVMNFAMLYLFIIRKRKNALAVMRLCGARKWQTALIYLGECIIITVPAFFLGTILFDILLKNCFAEQFPYMSAAFGLSVYTAIFGVYMVVMLIVLGSIIYRSTRSDVKQCLSEGKI
ncbi:MAG: ABC transporter permease [Oscillospiraceae bacterium]